MLRWKLLLGLFLGLAVVIAQAGAVHAAPLQQDATPITGTVQDVVVETNPASALQTVVITLLVNNDTQIVRVSVETAVGLGLIVLDESGNPVVDESMFGPAVNIDPATILPDETSASEEQQHPVGAKISEYFSNIFGVDYELVMSARSNGLGFGVISQSLWMTQKLGGDATLFQTILDAKKNHDYTDVAVPFGEIPQNWGQLKKALLHSEGGKGVDETTSAGNKKDNSQHSNGNGKPNDLNSNGKGKTENPGNGNINKPDTPPGQDKDNNQDKSKNNKDNHGNNHGNGKTK